MTNDSPYTHQLGRFCDECKPYLLQWFPELVPVQGSMKSLEGWMDRDQTPTKQEGIKMWLTELKMIFPEIKDTYNIPRIPKESHVVRNPIVESCELLDKPK